MREGEKNKKTELTVISGRALLPFWPSAEEPSPAAMARGGVVAAGREAKNERGGERRSWLLLRRR